MILFLRKQGANLEVELAQVTTLLQLTLYLIELASPTFCLSQRLMLVVSVLFWVTWFGCDFEQIVSVLIFFHNLPKLFYLIQAQTRLHNLLRTLLVVSLHLVTARDVVFDSCLKIQQYNLVFLRFDLAAVEMAVTFIQTN